MKKITCIFLSLLMLVSVCLGTAGCANNSGIDEAYRISADTGRVFADEKLATIEWSFQSDSASFFLDMENSTVNGYDASLPFDWNCTAINDRSTSYEINAFKFLTGVYKAYLKEKSDIYRDTIIAYMLDWVKANPTVDMTDEWAWHDDATARRVLRMSYYAYIWQDEMDSADFALIKESLDMQAELLADKSFYTDRHNHGMYQDMGLIAYAYLICDDTNTSREYFDLALSRSWKYFNYVFTPDGVHKEHSPNYAATCMYYIRYYDKLYSGTGLSKVEKIKQLLDDATVFLAHLVMPDGFVPSLGDSTKTMVDFDNTANDGIYYGLSDNPEYLYAFTDGREGTVPDSAAVFPKGGYAMMRSSWEDSAEEATYMLFSAATHSSSHKHGDDLSFLLYHGGPVIVEAGKRDYNYLTEQTAYCYSGYGHNVLFIDDEEFPVRISENGFRSVNLEGYLTRITDYDIESDIKYVSGIQKRFSGISQVRTLTYAQEIDFVQILDQIESDRSCKGTLIYHIAADIDAAEAENGWVLYRSGKAIAQIMVDGNRPFTLSTIRTNDGDSPYKTWIFEGRLEGDEGTVLKIDIELAEGICKTATNIQLLPLSPAA